MDDATKQRDSISTPDLDALEDEARLMIAHPNFERARAAFCDGLIGFHVGRRTTNIGLGYTLGWATAVLIVFLDREQPIGVTAAEIIQLCTTGGLAGRKAVKGAVDVLLSFGLIERTTHAADGRAKRLMPTGLMLDIQREYMIARLTPLALLRPLPSPVSDWACDISVLLAFFGGNVRAFARSRFRLYDGYPEIRAFMDRASGYPILLDLLRNVCVSADGLIVTAASPSTLAARFHVSPAHVRKLLQAASNEGWLEVEARNGRVRLDPVFHTRLIFWIALELTWTWRLVGGLRN